MGKLRVMSHEGDRTIVWDREQTQSDDQAALAAVREAEHIFEEQIRRGAAAFLVVPDAPASRLRRFDPEAEQIVMVPRVLGG